MKRGLQMATHLIVPLDVAADQGSAWEEEQRLEEKAQDAGCEPTMWRYAQLTVDDRPDPYGEGAECNDECCFGVDKDVVVGGYCCRPSCNHTHDCAHSHDTEWCHPRRMDTFPQRLRVLRQTHNFQTGELAKLLHVTPQYVARLEMLSCTKLPSIKLLLKMAALLHVTVGQLLGEVPIRIDITDTIRWFNAS